MPTALYVCRGNMYMRNRIPDASFTYIKLNLHAKLNIVTHKLGPRSGPGIGAKFT